MNTDLYYHLNKNISFARAESELLIQPNQLNPQGTAHGGELMKILDTIAGIVGRKHCKGRLVTKRFDDIVFHKPIKLGEIVTAIGQLAYVGNSTMEIMANLYVHDVNDFSNPKLAVSSFVTMVHLADWTPAKVPALKVTTKEEEIIYKIGEKKYMEIKEKINK